MEEFGEWRDLSDDDIADGWIVEMLDKKARRTAVLAVIDLGSQDPERCWAIALAILERIADEDGLMLANVGAGPLEDLLHRHGSAFIDRFVVQARRDRRFREAASCIWPSSAMDKALWERLRAIVQQPVPDEPAKRRVTRQQARGRKSS